PSLIQRARCPRDLHSFPTRRSSDLCAPPCRCPRGTIVDHELFNRSQFDVDLAAARSPARVFKKALQHADAVLKARFEGQRDIHKDRKSTRLNSSHVKISYAVFCWKK